MWKSERLFSVYWCKSIFISVWEPINVYTKWSTLSNTDVLRHESVCRFHTCVDASCLCHPSGFIFQRGADGSRRRWLPLISAAGRVVHLNSAFIGSFVCCINLPFTSSVQTPHSSSRFFSVFSSTNNLKVIWQKKNPPPAGALIEPQGAGAAGIHNGWLYLHMEVR